MAEHGLHRVSDAELKRLLKALHQGALRSPITRSNLIEAAFGHVEADLDSLIGMDVAAAQALVIALANERKGRRGLSLELQWMAPSAPGTASRDVLDLVKDLLSSAEKTVQVLGLRLDDSATITRSLRALIGGREVRCGVVLDLHDEAAPEQAAREFLELNFPDRHRPELSYCTFPVRGRALVVDAHCTLMTSGQLSATDETPGLDAGLVVRDDALAARLLQEWERLVVVGAVKPLMALPN